MQASISVVEIERDAYVGFSQYQECLYQFIESQGDYFEGVDANIEIKKLFSHKK